jgi:hypothetical protein
MQQDCSGVWARGKPAAVYPERSKMNLASFYRDTSGAPETANLGHHGRSARIPV